jgi:hypothetical protein
MYDKWELDEIPLNTDKCVSADYITLASTDWEGKFTDAHGFIHTCLALWNLRRDAVLLSARQLSGMQQRMPTTCMHS